MKNKNKYSQNTDVSVRKRFAAVFRRLKVEPVTAKAGIYFIVYRIDGGRYIL